MVELRAEGIRVSLDARGASLVLLEIPDRNGRMQNVLRNDFAYAGATIGRYANRLRGAAFSLDGIQYSVSANEGENALHGGVDGFDKRLWNVDARRNDMLRLTLRSEDGDQGFPGRLDVAVTYTVTERALRIDYEAVTNAPTVLNLTNHAYFNLRGEDVADVMDHRLMLRAGAFTVVDSALIPTGEIRSVAGTPMDFRRPRAIGERIDADDEQLAIAGGYDFNWIFESTSETLPHDPVAVVEEPYRGRVMHVVTTQPAVQLYAPRSAAAFALETQHFPDAPNHPEFPSTVLRPGQIFRSMTELRFSTR